MMNEKMDLLTYLHENGVLIIGNGTLEQLAELYTVEELREILKNFAEE